MNAKTNQPATQASTTSAEISDQAAGAAISAMISSGVTPEQLMALANNPLNPQGAPVTTAAQNNADQLRAEADKLDLPWYQAEWVLPTACAVGGIAVGVGATLTYQHFFGDASSPATGDGQSANNPAGHNQYTPDNQLVGDGERMSALH